MSPVIATMTSKGQVTIPKEVREALDLHQGDPILFEERDGVVVLRKRPRLDPTLKILSRRADRVFCLEAGDWGSLARDNRGLSPAGDQTPLEA